MRTACGTRRFPRRATAVAHTCSAAPGDRLAVNSARCARGHLLHMGRSYTTSFGIGRQQPVGVDGIPMDMDARTHGSVIEARQTRLRPARGAAERQLMCIIVPFQGHPNFPMRYRSVSSRRSSVPRALACAVCALHESPSSTDVPAAHRIAALAGPRSCAMCGQDRRWRTCSSSGSPTVRLRRCRARRMVRLLSGPQGEQRAMQLQSRVGIHAEWRCEA